MLHCSLRVPQTYTLIDSTFTTFPQLPQFGVGHLLPARSLTATVSTKNDQQPFLSLLLSSAYALEYSVRT